MLRTLRDSRGRSYGIGAVLCTVAVVVPLVWGAAPVPRELPFAENVAWLANDSTGDVVRLNVETGRVDARLGLESMGGAMSVGQGYGNALVMAGDHLAAIDLANLTWGASVSAEGDLFVADDEVYMLSRDGTVESLDPETLETKGEIALGATVNRPVVAGARLVVPVSDGTVAVVEGADLVDRFDAGDEEDHLEVSLVGDDAVALNLTDSSFRTFDASLDNVKPSKAVEFDAPAERVLVPEAAPEGPLWLGVPADGELLAVDTGDGSSDSVEVTEPGSELLGPVAVRDRVYLVDLDDEALVEVDASELEVVDRQPIDVEDPESVEMLVVGDSLVVNDSSSASAVVVDEDGVVTAVDKYSEEGVATPVDDVDLVSDVQPPESADPATPPDETPPQNQPPSPPGQSPPPPPGPGEDNPPAPTTTAPPATTTTTTPPDPEVDPPGAVGGLSATADDGRASVTWTAPSGEVDDYSITVSPAINGQTTFTSTGTSYTFTSLENGTQYSFTVSARNEGGAGPDSTATATPGRAPSVSGVSASRTGDREFSVSFSYNAGGRNVDTCTVTVGGTAHDANCSGGSGSVSGISTSNYNTAYTFRADVGTSLGSANASGSARSANKPLTVAGASDPQRFDGSCTWNNDWGNGTPNTRPYFSSARTGCPGQDGNPEPSGYIPSGNNVRATCQTNGGSVKDDNETTSTKWVRIDGYGYMNTLWFTTWNSNPEANLPAC